MIKIKLDAGSRVAENHVATSKRVALEAQVSFVKSQVVIT